MKDQLALKLLQGLIMPELRWCWHMFPWATLNLLLASPMPGVVAGIKSYGRRVLLGGVRLSLSANVNNLLNKINQTKRNFNMVLCDT
jgi:hypothetical protein